MSSNIKVSRICQNCNQVFVARTTVTKYCGDTCAKRAYKVRQRKKKIKTSYEETLKLKLQPYEVLAVKDYLTVKEAASLLSISTRTTYRLINNGCLEAVNLSDRLIRIKRSALDKMLTQF
ncbi:helix-turn-helix domain-containing protein [Arenibacter palladensis]|uniref:helix-turn-helix domain-containing protein n=1 Tax=Arenibacter palladensis TaxID=237373 RepID=UPI00349F5BA2